MTPEKVAVFQKKQNNAGAGSTACGLWSCGTVQCK